MTKLLPTFANMAERLISSFGFQVILLILASWYFLTENINALFLPYDGAYMRQLIKFAFEWNDPTFGASLNPLQALGSYNFPINYWFSPSALTSYLISGVEPDAVVIYMTSTFELFCSLWFLSKSMGGSPALKVSTSWLGCICVMPFIVPAGSSIVSFYAISGIIPYIVEHIAVSNIVLALIIKLRFDRDRFNWLSFLVLLTLVLYLLIFFQMSVILSLPAWICFASYPVISGLYARNYRGRTVLILLIGLVILFIPVFSLAAAILNSVPAFFANELVYGRPPLVFISILFHGPEGIGWGSSFIYLASFCGALFALCKDEGVNRAESAMFICTTILIMSFGLLTSFVFPNYRGPSLLYFEWFLWGLMFFFTCKFIESIIQLFKRNLKGRLLSISISGIGRFSTFLIPLLSICFIIFFNRPNEVLSLQMPPSQTKLIGFLERDIALRPGEKFRGSVATFNGFNPADRGTTWGQNVGFDVELWQATGNDHRAIGLWWYNIPTLFAYNQFMSPYYYYAMTRLFARPDDVQQRSVLVLTQPEVRLLGLFGVKYIITEKTLDPSTNLELVDLSLLKDSSSSVVAVDRGNATKAINLYKIVESNVGTFSPIQPHLALTAKEAISLLKSDTFDPRIHFTVDSPLSTELVPATESSFIWEKNRIRVTAKSAKTSLLVLPLEFSNTLQIDNIGTSDGLHSSRLLRVDVALTGILFSGTLDVMIVPKFGPTTGGALRFSDYLNAKNAGF